MHCGDHPLGITLHFNGYVVRTTGIRQFERKSRNTLTPLVGSGSFKRNDAHGHFITRVIEDPKVGEIRVPGVLENLCRKLKLRDRPFR